MSLLLAHFNGEATSTVVRIEAIGSSPKGQYVALEEYGKNTSTKKIFSRIQIVNLWKDETLKTFEINETESEVQNLDLIRNENKKIAMKYLEKFNIN